ncbi:MULTISPECIES: SixA phosphatase family protein [unclassified Sphingomonas]|uniref:SixA phosphatase family protein n=1 Tax=unclassified Sphingomonas TaxID=196159 RepID=UPI0006F810FB|nr:MULTISPECIES: histidine phosphatase family protein [unclassified Sphingomonas]KQM65426.1 phosphohistidine phosphatase [Sphingomonas sp. Leaf16]KQN17028.1 phosphohistidine phosphatase [Sphingomonas sp. Leaf32]KQN17202.1 phosphohistidine phosphatase [Sphingomonas sp. Leaf29]
MKTLTLLRHAKSGWDDPALSDYERPLNAKGARAATAMGAHVRQAGLTFDTVVASSAKRVVETLEHFRRGYGTLPDAGHDRMLYLASAATMLDVIRALPADADRALLVGHNPGLEDLVLLLSAESNPLRGAVEEKFPTASVAVLELVGDWASAGDGCGHLTSFVRPRDLDPSLGPNHE